MFLFPIPLGNKTLPPTPSRRKIIPGSAPIDLRYMYLFDFFPEAVMVFDVMAATLPVRNVFPYTRFTQTSLTGLTHKLHLLVTLTPRHGTLIALRVAWGVAHDRVLTLYTKYTCKQIPFWTNIQKIHICPLCHMSNVFSACKCTIHRDYVYK